MSIGGRYWLPHPVECFLPCVFHSTFKDNGIFLSSDNQELQHPSAKLGELAKVFDQQLEGVNNVVDLEEVSNAALLHTVRVRFLQEKPQIYTRVSRILIALNPFKSLAIYGASEMRKYLECMDSMDLPPHIFGVGADALKGLKLGGASQAVLISGESGAGKTESTKLILSFVAESLASAKVDDRMQDRIMQTSPILESFGNAMTVRNNNSSRFGKWMQLMTSQDGVVTGASVTDYLLELTRVTTQVEQERNYHVFFEVCTAAQDFRELKIGEAKSYRYTNGGQLQAPGIDDRNNFAELRNAMKMIGICGSQEMDIFKVVVGILTLGNVSFEDVDEKAHLEAEGPVARAAQLLGVDVGQLKMAMLTRKIVIMREVTYADLNSHQAGRARDAFARLLYGGLFTALIGQINDILKAAEDSQGTFFGVLDIAGFESFEQNSLEQLFINLSNEHLQKVFNSHVFESELKDYKEQGIQVLQGMTYADNSDIIALIDSKGSILALLDEEVSIGSGTDETFLAKIVKAHSSHVRFDKPKRSKDQFVVKHFAGDVVYTVVGFLEKNTDRPPEDTASLLDSSTNAWVKKVGARLVQELQAAQGGGRKKPKTMSSTFRISMAKLRNKISEAEPHFIRCIKPNAEKVPSKFTAPLILDQLRSSGVFEAVQIRQAGYSSRIPFMDFIDRYHMILPAATQKSVKHSAAKDPKQAINLMILSFPDILKVVGHKMPANEIKLGKSKIFSKAQFTLALDRCMDYLLAKHVTTIQSRWRGRRARDRLKNIVRLVGELGAWSRENKFYEGKGPQSTALYKWKTTEAMSQQVEKVDKIIGHLRRWGAKEAIATVEPVGRRMRQEMAALAGLEEASQSIIAIDLKDALVTVKDLEFPEMPLVQQVTARYEALKVQVPLEKAMRAALESHDKEDCLDTWELLQEHGLHNQPKAWIAQIEGAKLVGPFQELVERIRREESDKNEKQRQEEEAAAAAAAKQAQSAAKQDESPATLPRDRTSSKLQVQQQGSEVAKTPSKARKKTITGLDETAQLKILAQLQEACRTFNTLALKRNLATAMDQGMPADHQVLQFGQTLFEQMQTRDFVLRMVKENAHQLEKKNTDMLAMKGLHNLFKQVQRLGILETDPEIEKAKKVLQLAVRKHTRSTIKGKFFQEVQLEEAELLEGAFSNLWNFETLKSADEWEGHTCKVNWWFSTSEKGKEVMLKFTKMDLAGALTKVPKSVEAAATDMFNNIKAWMGDRVASETQRASLCEVITDAASANEFLVAEMYVQLMKQLTDNESQRSERRGWELMIWCLQQDLLSADLYGFLHAFMMNAARKAELGMQPILTQCLVALNASNIEEKGQSDENISVIISLIDYTKRKVRLPGSCNFRQLCDRLADQLFVKNGNDFAVFVAVDGLPQPRLIPDNAKVGSTRQKWMEVREKTGRDVNFVFKRRMLQPDEVLRNNDPVHAQLTYRQAVHDFLIYPLAEERPLLVRIAASVLWEMRSSFKQAIEEEGKLEEEGILEQCLPWQHLRDHGRSAIAKDVLEAYKGLEETLDPKEIDMHSMGRALYELQALKLFGAYCWLGKQVKNFPGRDLPIKNSPTKFCNLQPGEDEDEGDPDYWVCVDSYGVRFICGDFVRGFLFNVNGVERLLQSAGKASILQLVVVSSVSRSPRSIVIKSKEALDIAYMIHMIIELSKAPRQA